MRLTAVVSLLCPAPAPADRDRQCQGILGSALSLAGSVAPFPAQLESLLDDKDVEVGLSAVASLSDLKNSRTIPALHKALNDEVPEASFAAVRSLWALKDPDGKKSPLSILSGESKASSGYFAKQKRDALRMMHTPKPMFLFATRTGAGFAPVPGLGTGVSSMQALPSDPGMSGRATAALKEALQDKESSVRAAAVHALVLRDDPAFQPDVVPLLDDKPRRPSRASSRSKRQQ